MNRREATLIVVIGVSAGLVMSLLRGSFWTLSMVWEIAFWIALLAGLSLWQHWRRAKHS